MSDTHVNAFYMNVDEKKQAVEKAKAELAEAERALKAHPDFEEPKETEVEPQAEPKPEVKETKPKSQKK